jgi:hypothetical protein
VSNKAPAYRKYRPWSKKRAILDLLAADFAPIKDPDELYNKIHTFVIGELGLPESDALWFYRTMQKRQWNWEGIPITDLERTCRVFKDTKFFPSLR